MVRWSFNSVQFASRFWSTRYKCVLFSDLLINEHTVFEEIWSWIICDGDIDPEWVESLNSVMDDNKLLSLPSGWRIQFGSNVNFIFETHDLKHASPATISRMGIVYISEEDLKINDYIVKLVGEPSGYLSEFFSEYFTKGILIWTIAIKLDVRLVVLAFY